MTDQNPLSCTWEQFAGYFYPYTFTCSCGKPYNLPPKSNLYPHPSEPL